MLAYADKKQRVQGAINAGLNKETSNLFRHRQKAENRVSLKDFNRVISVDSTAQTAEVEGLTTYEDLVHETLKFGFMPAVVPELKTITIGGALAGVGIESSSFRYGLVHETILAFEVLLPDGQVVECRADNEHSDLFFAFPNSYGTLGYALKVTVKIVPVNKYVKLTHRKFNQAEAYYQALSQNDASIDFIDGSVFSDNDMVVTTGQFVDQAPLVSDYTYMNIYYQSIQQMQTDYLTTEDYIWRWDTDWFWCSRVFGLQNKLMRLLFGKNRLNSRTYWKIMHLAHYHPILSRVVKHLSREKESVIQDVVIPVENCVEFFNFFNDVVGIKPFWNCPTRVYNGQCGYGLFPLRANQLYVNFGFWDTVHTGREDGYINQQIEHKVIELGGLKSLYSNSFYTEEEFWQIFDKPCFETVKKRYDANNLKSDLYQKCVVEKAGGH